jgi:hypothetical protein
LKTLFFAPFAYTISESISSATFFPDFFSHATSQVINQFGGGEENEVKNFGINFRLIRDLNRSVLNRE